MKRLVTLLAILSLTYMASAMDNRIPDYRDIRPATPEMLGNLQTATATVLSSYGFNYEPGFNFLAPVSDTLNEYFKRATQFRIYGITINGNQFPLVGTNTIYFFVGQKFTYNIDPNFKYKMTGVLIPLAINVQGGTYSDTNQVNAYPTDLQGLPQGNPFAIGKLYLNKADSNSIKPKFTYLSFDSSGVLTNNFIIFVQTRHFTGSETDFIAIWANNQGDGKGESRASVLLYNNGWFISNFSDLQIDMGGGLRPDFDVLILPVIEKEQVAGVDEEIEVNGIRLSKIYPQPIIGEGNISFKVSSAANLRIDLLDLNGRQLKSILNQVVVAGENIVSFNTDGIASGTYLISFRSGNSGFAVKTAIVR